MDSLLEHRMAVGCSKFATDTTITGDWPAKGQGYKNIPFQYAE
jgi:hypothetical protein